MSEKYDFRETFRSMMGSNTQPETDERSCPDCSKVWHTAAPDETPDDEPCFNCKQAAAEAYAAKAAADWRPPYRMQFDED